MTLNFPVRVPLNFPYAIGAATGQQLDDGVMEALAYQLNGLDGALSRCDDQVMQKCRFTEVCSSVAGQQQQRNGVVADRVRRGAECVALFPEPYCVTFWRKQTVQYVHPALGSQEQQDWFPWQTCTNCLAARSATLCSHWWESMQITNVYQGGQWERGAPGFVGQLDGRYLGHSEIVESIDQREKHSIF